MSRDELIRLWKDEEYRLDNAERSAACEANPAGQIEVADEVLGAAVGGEELTTVPCTIVLTISYETSCTPECDKTVLLGTCGAYTYGCCTPN